MSTTARAARSASGAKRPDAIELLRADHQEVESLIDEFEKLAEGEADAGEKALVAAQICAALSMHAQIEEEVFYPAARAALPGEHLLLDEALVEHASAKELIAQVESMDIDEPLFDAKVMVLGEYVKHHVKEEQDEMFPKVRKSGLDLGELGQRLTARKRELQAQAAPEVAESA